MNVRKIIYKKLNNNSDLLKDILVELVENGCDSDEVADVVNSDNNLYNILRNECLKSNTIKREHVENDMTAIFGG